MHCATFAITTAPLNMRKTNLARTATLAIVIFLSHLAVAQTGTTPAAASTPVFPKGQRAPAGNFTGTVWVQNLVSTDSIYTLASGSVTFEPGARSNWRFHPAGQILLVT